MATLDLVFEGGGAKGMVFVGALERLFKNSAYRVNRLIGTSAGAITVVTLAAGYTTAEMLAALSEKDEAGKPVFESFLGIPGAFDADTIHHSEIRRLLADINIPIIPDFMEGKVDDWLAGQIAGHQMGCHVFSFSECGGWYSADAFVAWMQRKLNEGQFQGALRRFGDMTLEEFFAATGIEMTLVAADTTWARMLLLNHRTAPRCPVVWAARMSMSVPLLWQEVVWQPEWGTYSLWDPDRSALVEQDMIGHTVVDGGLLSNFPIALLMSDRQDVTSVVGSTRGENVLGLLIDEKIPVPNRPPRPGKAAQLDVSSLETAQRLQRLINTATTANDNMAIALFARNVVHLPAGGYNTTQFDMTDAEREALLNAGRDAMDAFLTQRPASVTPAGVHYDFAPSATATALANQAAPDILTR